MTVSLDAQIDAAARHASSVNAALRKAEVKHRAGVLAHAFDPLRALPDPVVDLRRDRDAAHEALKGLFWRKIDVLRAVQTSRRPAVVIDWAVKPFTGRRASDEIAALRRLIEIAEQALQVDQAEEALGELARQVDQAEEAAGMTPTDIARADRSMAFDITSHVGASARSARLGALHTRLRDAQDFRAERIADAKLRARFGMPAS